MENLIDAKLTADRATDWLASNTAENAVNALLCQPLDRQNYEAQCAQAHVEPWTDARVHAATYALTHAEMPTDAERWLEHGLARMRLNALRVESRRTPSPAIQIAMATCAGCGASVPAGSLMSASRRSGVCPDCYDRQSR